MNDSLVILLLLCFSICHGKEQDYSPPSGILPTTKYQNKVETPLKISCPDPADIEPCECINTSKFKSSLELDCSNVQDEEQLRKVFSAFFPTTDFYMFRMNENHGVKVLEDGVFGNVSFRQLNIFNSVLETVETDTLTASLSTLTYLYIGLCSLETFPFERLTEFTSLEYLSFFGNKIHTVPPLSSSSLMSVDLSWNLITDLPSNMFKLLPAVMTIDLCNNLLTEIPKGTFTGLPKLNLIKLSYNSISYLHSLTFELVSWPNSAANLELTYNNIEDVEVDTFKGVAANSTIDMYGNVLTILPEEVWRPVLEKDITVNLAGNDLACGCDLAWLVRDPQLLKWVWTARCSDGTLLTDLNPADFDMCG